MRIKKFAWLPTRVHIIKYFQCGFKWFDYVWLDASDGKYYITEKELEIDLDSYKYKL